MAPLVGVAWQPRQAGALVGSPIPSVAVIWRARSPSSTENARLCAPPWLAGSGLACTAEGFVAVGADLRSISHAAIFAAGDIIDRVDRKLERSGVHAVKAGPVLAANLRAAIGGTELRQYCPRRRTLYLLGLGDRRAIGTWGRFVATGRFVWWLKDWIDRRFVELYTRRGTATASPSEQD